MEAIRRVQQRLLRSRRLPAAGIGLTLLILAGTIVFGTLQLRARIRAQMVGRDADILHGVAQMVQVTQESDKELGSQLEHLPDQFAIALQISELNQFNGVIATRLFQTNGQFAAALPPNVSPASLRPDDLDQLKQIRPVSRFHDALRVADIFVPGAATIAPDHTAPILEVLIPLHRQGQSTMLGAVQFLIDGGNIAGQFRDLDRHLAFQSALAFGVGGVITTLALAWAFRRLRKMNRLLIERTDRLLRTNEELALSAKASAVGAITAHLVHGLSSPLAGLEELVTNRNRDEATEGEWQEAVTTTRQVKQLIEEVVRILGEESAVDRYEITLAELVKLVEERFRAVAGPAGARLATDVQAQGSLFNREANLALLILENLIRNALQVTPPGHVTRLAVYSEPDATVFEVCDEGPGVPAELRPRLFTPCRSTRPGGHGIGLAICKQLANHLEATLELKGSSAAGSVFVLRLPRNRLAGKLSLDPKSKLG
jgi:signal transduction histidine kinase